MRWSDYVSERRLTCGPKDQGGHRIPNTMHVLECGFIRCSHWIAAENRECGRWLFVYTVRGGRAIVAEVQVHEIEIIRKLVTPAEILDYLGVLGGQE